MEPSWTANSKDGSQLAGYELGGSGDVLLIAHATGLCGAMYQLLADELTDTFRIVALDFRGHGNSARALDLDYSWERMAEDVNAVARHIDAGPLRAFGHSMGGAALLLAERNVPSTFQSLFLFEPIILPHDYSPDDSSPNDSRPDDQGVMGATARRRRHEFESRAEVLYRYASRPPFNRVQAGFVAAYVDNGFADQPDGRVVLKCAPEVEALVFENGRDTKLSAVQHVTTPTAVAIGRDEPSSHPSRLGPPLAAGLANGHLIRYDHIDHFGPLQDPWTIARDIERHVAEHG